eukprot:jgi/Botrbrau1/8629/Bobra.0196s0023.1
MSPRDLLRSPRGKPNAPSPGVIPLALAQASAMAMAPATCGHPPGRTLATTESNATPPAAYAKLGILAPPSGDGAPDGGTSGAQGMPCAALEGDLSGPPIRDSEGHSVMSLRSTDGLDRNRGRGSPTADDEGCSPSSGTQSREALPVLSPSASEKALQLAESTPCLRFVITTKLSAVRANVDALGEGGQGRADLGGSDVSLKKYKFRREVRQAGGHGQKRTTTTQGLGHILRTTVQGKSEAAQHREAEGYGGAYCQDGEFISWTCTGQRLIGGPVNTDCR